MILQSYTKEYKCNISQPIIFIMLEYDITIIFVNSFAKVLVLSILYHISARININGL